MEANRHDQSGPPPQRRQIIVLLVGAIILALGVGLTSLNAFRSGVVLAAPLRQGSGEAGRPLPPGEQPRPVLVLHSYHQGYPWTDSIQQALAGVLSGVDFDLHVVYMDTKRLTESDSFRLTEELLRRRYLAYGTQFEAIVASDDPALDFLLAHRDRLFPGVPVVFLGANAFDQTRLVNVTGFTGVNEEISLRETVDVLLRLRPQTRRLAVISDATQTGQRNLELMHALAPEYAARIDITYLEALEPEALAASLRQLTDQDAVLFLSYYRTPAGRSLSVAESVGFVSQVSAAPMFGCWDFMVGPGSVGGKVVNGPAQGQAAAQMVLDILGGQKAENIPVLMASPNHYVFDYQQLQRFKISPSLLPQGSIVLNPPPASWLDYWPWLMTGAGIILLQAMFISQLSISRDKMKRSEEALRRSEENFKAIANYTVNWESWFGPEGRYLWVNPAVERFTGYTPVEILAMPDFLETLIAAEDRAMVARQIAGAGRGNPGEAAEFRYLRKDGSIRWLSVSGQAIFDNQGQALGVRASGQDITDRKLAEEALRESRGLLDATQRLAHTGGWEWDVARQTMTWTDETYRLHGMTPGEPPAGSPTHIAQSVACYEPGDRPVILAAFQRCAEQGQAYDLKFPLTRIDGRRIWIQTMAQPVLEGGRVVKITGFIIDITDRQQAEESLRESEARFRLLFQNINSIFTLYEVVLDEHGRACDYRYLELNAAFEKLTGMKAADLIGRTLLEVFPLTEPYWLDIFEEVFMTGIPTHFEEYSKELDTYIELNLYSPQKGQLALISSDITARKALEAENQKLTEQFYQAQKLDSIGQLAGGIAHDFNNLLVPIIGYAELGLMAAPPASNIYGHFEQVKEAGERAANLTRQILAFSRQQVLEMKVVDLNQVVLEFEKMLGRLIGEPIRLKTHLAADLPLIKADKGQLEQVLLNLVVNARDAMPNGGRLTLETAQVGLDEAYAAHYPGVTPGSYVMLAVSDSGHGMDAATQQRIFEPFFTTKARGHGTGLGLSTVFGIVKQHGGNIWVYSELGQGTTFKVYLPVAETPAPIVIPAGPAGGRLAGDETILVVEDEAVVRQLVSRTLREYGYRVLEADGPPQGLALAAAQPDPLHLLLTDVIMPGLNGRELYQQLSGGRPGLKVLYMSGYTDDAIAHHGVLDEGVAFLQKPFAIRSLLQKVRAALG